MTEEKIYTEEDEKEGPEHREARREHRLINEELSKYSWKANREFAKLYPCTKPSYTIEVFNKEYLKEQAFIKALMKVKGDQFEPVEEHYTIEYLQIESPEEFWRKWKKFKKIRSFL